MAPVPTRNTLIVSDVHLCGVMPGGGLWMPYRQRDHLFDADLAALLISAAQWYQSASLEIIFNGDMFDFDAPDIRNMAPGSLPNSVSHTEAGAASLIGSILDDHPAVVGAIGRCLASGCSVVFVPGNHDAQLAFPAVRRVITQKLTAAAGVPSAGPPSASSMPVAARIKFVSWFYRTPDGFHIEHGHQYDPVCMLENMLPTTVNGAPYLEETVGSVASYHVPAILGCINPYAIDPFDIRPKDVFASAVRCGKDRPVSPQWYAIATTHFIRQMAAVGPAFTKPTTDRLRQTASAETGSNGHALVRHSALFAQKKSLDHFAAIDGWVGYGVDTDRRLRTASVHIADIHATKGVIMGHTHRPYSVWINGRFFGNTGSWAPKPMAKPPVGSVSSVAEQMPPLTSAGGGRAVGESCAVPMAPGASGSFVWISTSQQPGAAHQSTVGTYHFLRRAGSDPARIVQICPASG